jgi:hypothetical protein
VPCGHTMVLPSGRTVLPFGRTVLWVPSGRTMEVKLENGRMVVECHSCVEIVVVEMK